MPKKVRCLPSRHFRTLSEEARRRAFQQASAQRSVSAAPKEIRRQRAANSGESGVAARKEATEKWLKLFDAVGAGSAHVVALRCAAWQPVLFFRPALLSSSATNCSTSHTAFGAGGGSTSVMMSQKVQAGDVSGKVDSSGVSGAPA